MAQRRMFSPQIVESDAFLDMPLSTQALYFHLGMYADDDGFVNPRKIVRMLGSTEDDLKMLVAKRFVMPFETGVIVIKHWRMNNLVRKDFYRPTQYEEEKSALFLKENKSYTFDENQGEPVSVNKMLTARSRRIGKDRIGKDNNTNNAETSSARLIEQIIYSFKDVNPSYKKWFNNKTQRAAAKRLAETHGVERVAAALAFFQNYRTKQYCPTIATPNQLEDKWTALEQFAVRIKNQSNAGPAF